MAPGDLQQTAPSELSPVPPTRPSLPGLAIDLGAENSAPVNSGGSEARLKRLLLSSLPSSPRPQLVCCSPLRAQTASTQCLAFSVNISFHFPMGLRGPGGQGWAHLLGAPGPSTGPGTAGSPIQ